MAAALAKGVHYIMAITHSPWAEMFMPAPGRPKEAYQLLEEGYRLSKGPEGIYMRPADRLGFGWDFLVS
jgi:L-rhamnonate dehydratase